MLKQQTRSTDSKKTPLPKIEIQASNLSGAGGEIGRLMHYLDPRNKPSVRCVPVRLSKEVMQELTKMLLEEGIDISSQAGFDVWEKRKRSGKFLAWTPSLKAGVYDEKVLEAPIPLLEKQRSQYAEKILSIFLELQQQWGFDVFETYLVTTTMYGPGGTYFHNPKDIEKKIGHVQVHAKCRGGLFPAAVHEMVHLGIEGPIVKHFNLDQQEKERVVDLLCLLKFKTLMEPEYKMHEGIGDDQINPYVTAETIDDLPRAIQVYVTKHPRTSALTALTKSSLYSATTPSSNASSTSSASSTHTATVPANTSASSSSPHSKR